MHRTINIENAQKIQDPIYIDMRSPSEYAVGHISGAVNIPLLTDAERAEVGRVYKQENVENAKHLGLSIVSVKLPELVSQIRDLHRTGRVIIIYCWRGGMRSKAIVNVLDLMGIPSFQLIGGYKNYRQYILRQLQNFQLKPRIIVLCGSTGVGKTTLLSLLSRQGAPVIDLEKLANHRGSAFGHIGIGAPTTAQTFDAAILSEMEALNNEQYIIVECESKRIGNVYVPDVLYEGMKNGQKILAFAALDTRIDRLIAEYTNMYSKSYDAILHSIKSLTKRLGQRRTEKLLMQMDAGQLKDVVHSLLVHYYDPLYGYEKADPVAYDFTVCADNLTEASSRIMDYLNNLGGRNIADSRRDT